MDDIEELKVLSVDSLPLPASAQSPIQDPVQGHMALPVQELILSELKTIREVMALQAAEIRRLSDVVVERHQQQPPQQPQQQHRQHSPGLGLSPRAISNESPNVVGSRTSSNTRFGGLQGLDQVMRSKLLNLGNGAMSRQNSIRAQPSAAAFRSNMVSRLQSISAAGEEAALQSEAILPGHVPEDMPGRPAPEASATAEIISQKAKAVLRLSHSFAAQGSASLEQVRRHVQDDIMTRAKLRTDPLDAVPESPQEYQEPLFDRVFTPMAEYFSKASEITLRAGGVLPWSDSHFGLSLAYQVAVLSIHIAILVFMVFRLSVQADLPRLFSDAALQLGAVLGLCSVLVFGGGTAVQSCVLLLETAADTEDFLQPVKASCGHDAILTLFLWLCYIAVRFAFLFTANVRPQSVSDISYLVSLVVSSGEALLLATAVLRVSRYLTAMVESFCYRFWVEMDYKDAVDAWNILQATVRMACGSVEHMFAVLQTTVFVTALVVVWDIISVQGQEGAAASMLILLVAIAHIFLRAATVTEACARVPQLINSTSLNDVTMDADRRYCVEYIAASHAGFYAFNVRISVSLVIRLFHYTGLAAATIARLVVHS